MLQADGSEGNPCTCFMFMKPTDKVKELLTGWIQAAEEADAKINQVSKPSLSSSECVWRHGEFLDVRVSFVLLLKQAGI